MFSSHLSTSSLVRPSHQLKEVARVRAPRSRLQSLETRALPELVNVDVECGGRSRRLPIPVLAVAAIIAAQQLTFTPVCLASAPASTPYSEASSITFGVQQGFVSSTSDATRAPSKCTMLSYLRASMRKHKMRYVRCTQGIAVCRNDSLPETYNAVKIFKLARPPFQYACLCRCIEIGSPLVFA